QRPSCRLLADWLTGSATHRVIHRSDHADKISEVVTVNSSALGIGADGSERDGPCRHANGPIGVHLPKRREIELRPRREVRGRFIAIGSGLYLPEDCRLEFPASSSAASELS